MNLQIYYIIVIQENQVYILVVPESTILLFLSLTK